MERDLGISTNVFKNLCDKSSDKRKLATKEIEKIVKKQVESKADDQLKSLIQHFDTEYISSTDPQQKKAGLIAFAAIALGLLNDESMASDFLSIILPPVIFAMKDMDAKVRLQACETMYNITKSLRVIILPKFNEIFTVLISVIPDLDEDVKRIAQQLDRVLKDVVTEGIIESKPFDIQGFMDILCKKLNAPNSIIRQLLISWINVLNNLPNVNLFQFFPWFLQDLMKMVGDSNKEIKVTVVASLNEFLKDLRENPKNRTIELDRDIISKLLELLNERINVKTKIIVLEWLQEYLKMFNYELDKGNKETYYNKSILSRIHVILDGILRYMADEELEIRRASGVVNELIMDIIKKSQSSKINFPQLISLLRELLDTNQNKIVLATINWIKHLLTNFQNEVIPLLDEILQCIIQKLYDSEENIVKLVGDVLGNFTYSQEKFHLVISKLLTSFKDNPSLNVKSHTIIKRLCINLHPTKVFIALAEQLLNYKDYKFVSLMVQKLDQILLTDKELSEVRKTLKNISSDKENRDINIRLFESFYRTWVYNPVSTITFCFLTQQYELAYRIICSFADTEIDIEILTQIARLVQLLESPIFVYLRLQLLEIQRYPYLLKSLNGLLMILPQGKAFNALRLRLKNVVSDREGPVHVEENPINIENMMKIYLETQKSVSEESIDQIYKEEKISFISQFEEKENKESVIEISTEKISFE